MLPPLALIPVNGPRVGVKSRTLVPAVKAEPMSATPEGFTKAPSFVAKKGI